MRVIRDVVEFPPQHSRHEQLLVKFNSVATFEKSVFVMTKFPDPKKSVPVNTQLNAVIQASRRYATRFRAAAMLHG